jgi:hypothetical protein
MALRNQTILGVCLAALMLTTTGLAAPKIVFDQTVFDVGKTSPVGSVVGQFHFTNAGDEVLKIEKPDTPCGCTVAKVEPDTLKPGQTGMLDFTLDLTQLSGKSERYIIVPSNDPASPKTRLTLKADVAILYEADPQVVDLGEGRPGTVVSNSVVITRKDGQPIRIARAIAQTADAETRVEEVPGSSGRSARIVITSKLDGKPRRFAGLLQVYVEDAPKPVMLVPLTGYVIGELKVEPEVVVWNINDPGAWNGPMVELASVRRIIVTGGNDGEPLRIRNFASSFEDLMIKVEEIDPGRRYAVLIRLPQPPRKSVEGIVAFDTNVPGFETVEVPVRLNVP